MYYKTLRTSTTGKKFAAIQIKMNAAAKAQNDLCKQFKIERFRPSPIAVAGGFSSVMFQKGVVVDTKLWRNVEGDKNEWMPRASNKAGKEIRAIFDAMPVVWSKELNQCVTNVGISMFSHIGFGYDDEHFGFTTNDDWKIKLPEDCEEILSSEYQKRFKKGK